MGSTFNPQILVEKLSKLNNSQQSIETLSHWCIFHMNKAKIVVETWERQFHCSPREQRLAFLYLANDIIQNSRRKGPDFVAEFWKVLSTAIRDVMDNGDEIARNSALRLINIWEERKVFGSRGQILKEEFLKRQPDNGHRNGKHVTYKPRPPAENAMDKIASSYQAVNGGQLDEEVAMNKCRNAISVIEKVDKEFGGQPSSDALDELKGQHAILKECIEQLMVAESSRANLVSLLQEALQEQEYKLDQVRSQLQVAQLQSKPADTICGNVQNPTEPSGNETHTSQGPHSFTSENEQVQVTLGEKSAHIEDPKAAAAAMAAKLSASASSAQMLSYVFSALGNPVNEEPAEKRLKIENDHPSYIPQNSQNSSYVPHHSQNSSYVPQNTQNTSYVPQNSQHSSYVPSQISSYVPQNSQTPFPPFQYPESVPAAPMEPYPEEMPPPPPTSPPPIPPLPPIPPEFVHVGPPLSIYVPPPPDGVFPYNPPPRHPYYEALGLYGEQQSGPMGRQ